MVKMPGLCEVCSKQASKYRCPTCGLSSCSLDCTRSHKIYCAPKQNTTTNTPPNEDEQQPKDTQVTAKHEHATIQPNNFEYSAEIQKLFAEYPGLRAKLQEIYRATLEEEWNAAPLRQNHSTHRGERHKYDHNNSRATWTAEKGFNRGLGKVRKWRESCEGGQCTDSDAEGFMKFITLVAGEREGLS